MSIKSFAINTTVLSGVKVLTTASQLLILPIIARYLSPDDFGLIAIAMLCITFSMIITDSGLGNSLIRTKDFIELEWLSIFWFVVFLALMMAGLIIALAPIIASFFSSDQLVPILNIMALILLLQGLIVIPQAEMQRSGRITRIALGEFVATFVGFGVAVWVAINGGGVWALVYQQVVFWAVRAISIITSSKLQIRLKFSSGYLKKHLSFGRDTVAFGMVNFFSVESQNIFLGKVTGTHALGLYSMANRFSELPGKVAIQPLYYILYSHLTKISGDIALLGNTIVSLTRILAIITFPAVAILAAGGETFFILFLSERWSEIAIIFAIIAPVGIMNAITSISNPVLMATGDTQLRLRIAIESTIIWVFALVIAIWFGLIAVAIAYVIRFLCYLPRFANLFLPKIGVSKYQYFSIFVSPSLISIIAVATHITITLVFQPSHIITIIIMAVEVLVAWLCLWLLQQHVLKSDIKVIIKMLGK